MKSWVMADFFKTKEVGQKIMAAAVNVPVSVMETAGEGGAWGIALLASYMINKEDGETLEAFPEKKGFCRKTGNSFLLILKMLPVLMNL